MAGLNQMPSDLESTETDNMKSVGQKVKQIPEQQNLCWQLLQWSIPALLPHCTESAQKNITEKVHTLSHLLSYSNRIKQQQNENSPDYKYSTVLSTGSKKLSIWPPLSRVYSAVTPHQQSTPDTFWARQCWKEVKTWMGYLFNPVCDNKLQIKKIHLLINKPIYQIPLLYLSTYIVLK